MRSFIKLNILYFLVLTITVLSLIELSEYVVEKKSNFNLKSNPRYLVLGHSHSECAFNDTLIKNLSNLSESGESYFYTYFKTKKLIEQNPSVKIVFIEFTNNQIDESTNNWIWKKKYMDYRYPKYSPFMSLSDKVILAKNNLSGYFNASLLSFNQNFGRILKGNFDYSKSIGSYLYLKRDKTDSLVNSMKDSKPQSGKVKASLYSLEYLTKTISLFEKHGKKVILIRSPQHRKYSGYANETIYQEIRNNLFSTNEYLDFSKFPLPNSKFGDLEHLNHKGAKVFSNWFAKLLDMGVLEKNNKQEIINREIKERINISLSKQLFTNN